ncbi:MAG: SDR family oxidoreductase [Candidatus Rokubacteria bacterium]|nr:SDR family oxidoreductase [Candidatus Rokubacteria bacterium]
MDATAQSVVVFERPSAVASGRPRGARARIREWVFTEEETHADPYDARRVLDALRRARTASDRRRCRRAARVLRRRDQAAVRGTARRIGLLGRAQRRRLPDRGARRLERRARALRARLPRHRARAHREQPADPGVPRRERIRVGRVLVQQERLRREAGREGHARARRVLRRARRPPVTHVDHRPLHGRPHHRRRHRAVPERVRRRAAHVRRHGRQRAVRLLPRLQPRRAGAGRRAGGIPVPGRLPDRRGADGDERARGRVPVRAEQRRTRARRRDPEHLGRPAAGIPDLVRRVGQFPLHGRRDWRRHRRGARKRAGQRGCRVPDRREPGAVAGGDRAQRRRPARRAGPAGPPRRRPREHPAHLRPAARPGPQPPHDRRPLRAVLDGADLRAARRGRGRGGPARRARDPRSQPLRLRGAGRGGGVRRPRELGRERREARGGRHPEPRGRRRPELRLPVFGARSRAVPSVSVTTALFDLTGKVALVTGGSRGLGRAMVLAFARAGADVVIASRKLESCKQTAAEVQQATGRRALPVACHAGHWGEVEALAETAYAEFGKVDVLVNNAGMSPRYDRVDHVSEDLWDKVLDVNLKGPFRLTALVGTRMAACDGGSIIMVSSVAAVRPSPDVIPYAAAKAGLNAMTEGFAHAFGPKVRVNCIMAGPFLTDISKAWDMEKFVERARKEMALGRGGEADEVVGAALYFASRASSFTTGAVLGVHGGIR